MDTRFFRKPVRYVNANPIALHFWPMPDQPNGVELMVHGLDGNGQEIPPPAPATYAWTFGDGSAGSGKTVSHTYTALGTFNATLTVTNDRGLAASKTQTIAVGATAAPK